MQQIRWISTRCWIEDVDVDDDNDDDDEDEDVEVSVVIARPTGQCSLSLATDSLSLRFLKRGLSSPSLVIILRRPFRLFFWRGGSQTKIKSCPPQAQANIKLCCQPINAVLRNIQPITHRQFRACWWVRKEETEASSSLGCGLRHSDPGDNVENTPLWPLHAINTQSYIIILIILWQHLILNRHIHHPRTYLHTHIAIQEV
jgi:hypothetical protein